MNNELLHEVVLIEDSIETRSERINRTSTMEFQLIYKETFEWLNKNQMLCKFHEAAIDDYIASRNAVLELGIFRTGLSLAAQAVEKLLKCYLLLDNKSTNMKEYRHEITSIYNQVRKKYNNLDLHKFDDYCSDLEKWYKSRYPDEKNQATEWMRRAIPDLDKFIYYLEENIPIPKKIIHLKYGGGDLGNKWSSIFVRLFADIYSQQKIAILYENDLLSSKMDDLENKFRKYRMYALLPSHTLEESRLYINKIEDLINRNNQT